MIVGLLLLAVVLGSIASAVGLYMGIGAGAAVAIYALFGLLAFATGACFAYFQGDGANRVTPLARSLRQ